MKITLKPELPGIRALFDFSPKTAEPMCLLVQRLLVEDNSLTKGERETIATYTSFLNNCEFCMQSHAGIAECHLGGGDLIGAFKQNFKGLILTPKMNMLLKICAQVQQDGKKLNDDLVNEAKSVGCTEQEIHDTVLITAAFCMYNRYVDALAINVPKEKVAYQEMGRMIATAGYMR
ncbi:MAG: carboxymuconolactone decarboxylase family protein [Bacteriovoracaceae bacterium]